METRLNDKFKKIRLLVTDFDGVMTDGHVYLNQHGEETVRCSRKDGMGVEMMKKAGFDVAVVSREENGVVGARCKKLKIRCWQSVSHQGGKRDIVKTIADESGLSLDEIAYMGDDINDLEVLEIVGLAITVGDGHPRAKKISHYVTAANGGAHAVREVCEMILEAKNIEASV